MLPTNVTIGEPIGLGYGSINAGEHTIQDLQELGEAVQRHVVTVDPNAPSCCIDGRHCLRTLAGGEPDPRAGVAGGALVTAYAAAELTGWFGNDDGSTIDRLQRLDALLNASGIVTGAHIDEAAEMANMAGGRTGCGADDKYLENVGHVASDAEAVEGLTGLLLGAEYNPNRAGYIDATTVQERSHDWDPVEVATIVANRDPKAVEVLYSDESPTKGHSEVLVVFNYVEDATIDRDALVAETGKQVFMVDMWYINKIARALAGGPNAEAQYQQLQHAAVAYQAGTYLTLCDGSQRPLLLQPAA